MGKARGKYYGFIMKVGALMETDPIAIGWRVPLLKVQLGFLTSERPFR